MDTQGEQGEQGKKGERGPSSLIPWIILTVVIVFSLVIVTHDYRQTNDTAKANKHSIKNLANATNSLDNAVKDLRQTKANVQQLRKSNCTLRLFLATARKRVYEQSLTETGRKLHNDKQALNGYTSLIIALDGKSYCPIPQKLLLPQARVN